MPRCKRKQSGTDVYHAVSRGNNQKDILHYVQSRPYPA